MCVGGVWGWGGGEHAQHQSHLNFMPEARENWWVLNMSLCVDKIVRREAHIDGFPSRQKEGHYSLMVCLHRQSASTSIYQ